MQFKYLSTNINGLNFKKVHLFYTVSKIINFVFYLMEIKLIVFRTHLFQFYEFTCTGSASIFIGISHLSVSFLSIL